jgi:hypothetical protein
MPKWISPLLALSLGLGAAAAFTGGCDDKGKTTSGANKDADEEVEEKPIEPAKIPPTALNVIKKEIGESTTIKRALVGQKRGKPYYEAKYNDAAGKRWMIQVAEDGKVYKKIEDDDPEPTK